MKKFLLLVPALLIFAGCASTVPTMQTRYELDANDNLVQRQYMTTSDSTACDWGSFNWCVAGGITAGVLLGVWGLDRIFNDDDNSTTKEVPYQSPLVPASGFSTTTTTSEFDNQFITPGYVTVN